MPHEEIEAFLAKPDLLSSDLQPIVTIFLESIQIGKPQLLKRLIACLDEQGWEIEFTGERNLDDVGKFRRDSGAKIIRLNEKDIDADRLMYEIIHEYMYGQLWHDAQTKGFGAINHVKQRIPDLVAK